MSVSAREVALRVTSSVRRGGVRLDLYLNEEIRRAGLDARDAALAHRIVLGVQQNLRLCDHLIESFSSRKLSKIEPIVADILRISVYQIVFLTKIPHSAVVNEAAELTKKHANPRAAAFVNAVLRKIASRSDVLLDVDCGDPYQTLALRYSHPEWFVRYFCDRFSHSFCEALLRANNAEPPITAWTNSIKTDRNQVCAELRESGVNIAEDPRFSDAFSIDRAGDITALPAFQTGLFYIQDPAAHAVITAAGVKPGMFLIDGCAAPGGKSFAAAIEMENHGEILSCDIQERKLLLISDGAARLGIDIIRTQCRDGRIPDDSLLNKADVVLADVPCSGFGVIRKKPDVRNKSPEEIGGLPEIQLAILSNLSRYVKPGGVLLYATCTILQEENEEVVRRFLRENPAFSLCPFDLPAFSEKTLPGMITFYPNIHGTDGFFIGKLKRNL